MAGTWDTEKRDYEMTIVDVQRKPMYDTRIPDAIDNAVFVAMTLGILSSFLVTLALIVIVGGWKTLVFVGSTLVALALGGFALAPA
jgi:hypothetical protein